jgi:hypothetical protein
MKASLPATINSIAGTNQVLSLSGDINPRQATPQTPSQVPDTANQVRNA